MLKWLLTVAVVVVVLGFVAPAWRQRGPRLPGDVALRWRGRDYFFPFATTIVLSFFFVLLSRLL